MTYQEEMGKNTMAIDATFWVAVSFVIFFGALIYLKIPQKISQILDNMISDIKNEINEEIKKAEQEINLLKKGAPEKINKIAIETSSELLKKLIGAQINNSSISAIVDDLSKRNGEKYYGN